jgi:DNA recombination protein RmuC
MQIRTPMELSVLAVLGMAILLAAALLIQQRAAARRTSAGESALLLIQQQSQQAQQAHQAQIEALRADLRESLGTVSKLIQGQLQAVDRQMQSQTASVGNRLDNATRVIGDVQKNLGELGRATQEIKELGQSVSKLEELLRAPKLRGGLGEYLLEDLLKQVLPATHFEMQHRFSTGDVVDAVIRTSDRLVAVDSKFPLENFRRLVEAGDSEGRGARKAFQADVRKHIDAIASKYILPDEGTFPFALMYIPAENVYYEIIVKDEGADGAGLHAHALGRKVIPVSPNSFYAYLQVIALGLRGLAIEKRAQEILGDLGQLQGDTGRLREAFDVLGTHIENASKKYDDTDTRLARFEGVLGGIVRKSIIDGVDGADGSGRGGAAVADAVPRLGSSPR